MKKFVLFLAAVFSTAGFAQAQLRAIPPSNMPVFIANDCIHCEVLEQWLIEKFAPEHPQVRVEIYNISTNEEASATLVELLNLRGEELMGVPVAFVGKEVVVGINAKIWQEAIDRTWGTQTTEAQTELTPLKNRFNPDQKEVFRIYRQGRGAADIVTDENYEKRRKNLRTQIRQPRKRYWGNKDQTSRIKTMTKHQWIKSLQAEEPVFTLED